MVQSSDRTGPLSGLRVIEFASIGPGPHCAMLLADLGAEVIRIEREGGNGYPNPIVDRGRATKTLDIRSNEGRDWCLTAIESADVVIEGMRPGVMERLGLGPDACHARNPSLVYGRVTGWGQEGPMAQMAGHDINYIGMTGALAAMGRPNETAAIPLNLVGDFGGGSTLLAFGIMSALFERQNSGKGQVVDAAIVDGTSSLMSFFYGLVQTGQMSLERDQNLLGGAAPFYRTYLCSDNREVAVGALEPKFFSELVSLLGLRELIPIQYDEATWSDQTEIFSATFKQKTRDEWAQIFFDTDCCVTPVLHVSEVSENPHMQSRGVAGDCAGVRDIGSVPRFSSQCPQPIAGKTSKAAESLLKSWQGVGRI